MTSVPIRSGRYPREHVGDHADADRARAALRRRAAPALAGGAGRVRADPRERVVLTGMQHKKYEATAQILLQPTDTVQGVVSPGSISSPADAQRDVNTYAQMITVDPVADAVRQPARPEDRAARAW